MEIFCDGVSCTSIQEPLQLVMKNAIRARIVSLRRTIFDDITSTFHTFFSHASLSHLNLCLLNWTAKECLLPTNRI